jgi:hypothetical protein
VTASGLASGDRLSQRTASIWGSRTLPPGPAPYACVSWPLDTRAIASARSMGPRLTAYGTAWGANSPLPLGWERLRARPALTPCTLPGWHPALGSSVHWLPASLWHCPAGTAMCGVTLACWEEASRWEEARPCAGAHVSKREAWCSFWIFACSFHKSWVI